MPLTGVGPPPRPRTPARRMLVSVARVAAFLSIITGAGALVAPDWIRDPVFYGGAIAIAIALTAALSRKKAKPAAVEEDAATIAGVPLMQPAEAAPAVDVDAIVAKVREEERSRWSGEVARSIDTVRRIREELSTAEFARDEAEQHSVALREQLAEATRQVEEHRSASDEKIIHADSLIAELNRELTAARAREEQVQTRLAALELEYGEKLQKVVDGLGADHDREIGDVTSQRDDAVRRVAELERALHEERTAREKASGAATDLQARLASERAAREDAERRLEALQAAHDEQQSARQDLAARLESEKTSLEQAAGVAAALQSEIAAGNQQRDELARHLEEVQRERDRERSARTEIERAAEGATAEIGKLQEKLKDLRTAFSEERDALTARVTELQHTATEERDRAAQDLAAARAEAHGLTERVVALTGVIEEAKAAHLRLEAESTERVAELSRASEEERSAREQAEAERVTELQRVADEEKAARERLDAEWSVKLQKIVAGMAADHENDIGTAMMEREGAKAEVRSLVKKIAELERLVEDEKAARGRLEAELQERLQSEASSAAEQIAALQSAAVAEKAARERVETEWSEKLQKIVAGMAADHENDIGNAMVEREEAKAEVRSLKQRIAELERTASEEKAARERAEGEWSEKLQKIVAGMAADHENDIGQITMEREAARAELRHLTIRSQEMQRDLDEQRAHAAPAVDETALRAKLDSEWSEKLQTIVNHLASDHEADIGKAMEEKEEARAAARTLEQRLATMERAMSAAEQKFKDMRDALVAKAEAAQRELAQLKQPVAMLPTQDLPLPSPELKQELADPFPQTLVPTPAPFPSPFGASEDEQRARAEVLDFAEQANAALRRTGPGTMALPAVAREGRRSMILFVHHDPNMRTMWRDQLHKTGYDVITAADGLEGLRLATAHKPDVVIADAQMPKMDGRALCRKLKSNAETSAIKVVLMSGMYTAEVPLEEGEPAFPPDQLLPKPVKLDALQTALANVLAT